MATSTPTTSAKPRPRRAGWVSVVIAALAAGAGFVVSCLASLVARIVWRVDPVAVPWGLLLAVGGSVSLIVLARAVARSAGLAAAGGWLVGLFYVFSPRTEGDYIIADDGLGYGYLLLAVVSVMSAAAWGTGS